MRDYLRRLSIVTVVALLIGLLFIGGNSSHAKASSNVNNYNEYNWILPAEGVITDLFGARGGNHNGIDIAGDEGDPIRAVAEGVVSKSYYSASYGHVVFIKHSNENIETVYAHLSERHVAEDDNVKQGEIIGKMGTTGRSTGVHLHFEVHNGEWTGNKENAFNPALVFSGIELGSSLSFNSEKEDKTITVMNNNFSRSEKAKLSLLESSFKQLNDLENTGDEEGLSISKDENDDIVHKVNEGETLSEIAKLYDVSTEQIVSRNNLATDVIFPNQRLVIKEVPEKDYDLSKVLVKKIKQVLNERWISEMFY